MKSQNPGTNILEIEVININSHGFWLFIKETEYFLAFKEFPWFKEAKIKDILNVQLLHDSHIYWPCLDVDLTIDMISKPDKYPLVYK
jgi:hypothetical protein